MEVTFDANGGILAGGSSSAEREIVGEKAAPITVNTNQLISTGLIGNYVDHVFVKWNTKADGTGIDISNYGLVTKPVTFFAIYYQSEYRFTGSEQVFTAPVSGIYQFQCWGAMGGQDTASQGEYLNKYGGSGAYTSGTIHLTAGETLYIHVGGKGIENSSSTGIEVGGYNGGGNAPMVGSSGSGGGATDVRTLSGNWNEDLTSRIMVAAGGGGGGAGGTRYAGHGGALVSSSSSAYGFVSGATQNSAGDFGGFGYGGSSPGGSGGGGGGWYGGGCHATNDTSGTGGSSYISGFEGCAESNTGKIFSDTVMLAGDSNMPNPEGGTETGHRDNGYAKVILVSED